MIKTILKNREDLRQYLFIRGYLITSNKNHSLKEFPFYGNWNSVDIGRYRIIVHKKQTLHVKEVEDTTFFIIGHCVNPFDNVFDENVLLENICQKKQDKKALLDYINELTGSFLIGAINGDKISFIGDAAGMLFGCYGNINDYIYISSHAQLVDDLCSLTKSDYIKDLEKYKYFYKYGLFFPGDLTQFQELKRILQNHVTHFDGKCFSIKRFYPCAEIKETANDEEYKNLVNNVAEIMYSTIKLALDKWDNVALSMTGGMDSKTTLACANGLYKDLRFYSYISMAGDERDAISAHKIASQLGIKHQIYNISERDEDFQDLETIKYILEHNNGGYKLNNNDLRKRIYLSQLNEFEVEIKSWVSEIARANYYKKFGLKKMPKQLSPRNMTSMYKIFTTQRKLAKQTDEKFKEFINKTDYHKIHKGFDESDMYLWEFRYSAWGGMVITNEHSYSSTIFIPYNNRKLLTLMLQAPIKKRITDEFHEDIIKRSNKKVFDCGITITNWNETKKRMWFEKLYFKLHSLFKHF